MGSETQIYMINKFVTNEKHTSPLSHQDAKTTAPAWPNLSNVCLSGRSYITEPQTTIKRPQDEKHSEG